MPSQLWPPDTPALPWQPVCSGHRGTSVALPSQVVVACPTCPEWSLRLEPEPTGAGPGNHRGVVGDQRWMNTTSRLLRAALPLALQALRGGVVSEVPCPHPWPWPADTWLAAPLTSPNLSEANPWIQLRLQLGPAISRRHLTGNKCSEMSPTPALCQSGSTLWRPLFSRDCSPQVSCSHDFHCPVCACACTCVPAPACPLAQTPPLSHMCTLTTPGVLPALKKYSSRGLRPWGNHAPTLPTPFL